MRERLVSCWSTANGLCEKRGRGAYGRWVRTHCKIAMRTAQAYLRIARLPEPEWNRLKHKALRAALWGAAEAVAPEEKKSPGKPPEAEPGANGPTMRDPRQPDAEIHETMGGFVQAEPASEYSAMREAELLLSVAVRRAHALVGKRGVETILAKILAEMEGATTH